MTGAPVPAGADCVLRQEDTESDGQTVTFHAPVEARANVCFAGEDIAPGNAWSRRAPGWTKSPSACWLGRACRQ